MPERKAKQEAQKPAVKALWSRADLLERLPFNVAIIDRDYNIVEANTHFADYFGPWQDKKCYEVYKKRSQPCENCQTMATFDDGGTRVSDEVGIDQHGRSAHYVVHSAALRSRPDGPVECVLEMSSDVTETKRWQQEYQILFDRVPCYITVIDRDFRIIRANESFRCGQQTLPTRQPDHRQCTRREHPRPISQRHPATPDARENDPTWGAPGSVSATGFRRSSRAPASQVKSP